MDFLQQFTELIIWKLSRSTRKKNVFAILNRSKFETQISALGNCLALLHVGINNFCAILNRSKSETQISALGNFLAQLGINISVAIMNRSKFETQICLRPPRPQLPCHLCVSPFLWKMMSQRSKFETQICLQPPFPHSPELPCH